MINPGIILFSIAKNQAKQFVIKRGLETIRALKTRRSIKKGSYTVYASEKCGKYGFDEFRRNLRTTRLFIKALNPKTYTHILDISKSFYRDLNQRIKYQSLKDMQKNIKLNIFDKAIFDVSQKNEGIITLKQLKSESVNVIKEIFGETKKAEEVQEIFNKYIEFRPGQLERIGFLNSRPDGSLEVTDLFFERLNRQGFFDNFKNIELDISKYHLYLIDEAIKNKGINLEQLLKEFKKDKNIKDPSSKIKIVQNACDRLTKYGFFEYKDGKYSITEKAVFEAYSRKNFDLIEKTILDITNKNKDSNSFDKQEVYNSIFGDKKLLSNLLKQLPKEEVKTDGKTQEKEKTFELTRWDANVLFKEFESGKLTLERLRDNLNLRYADVEEAQKQFDIYVRRLQKNVDNGYVSLDAESSIYNITEKGRQAAENVNKTFQFTSYDANVVLRYINQNNGKINGPELMNLLKTEYKDKEYIRNQHDYLIRRFEKNVAAGYLHKDSEGNYMITEKGREEAEKYIDFFERYIEIRLDQLERAKLINGTKNGSYLKTDLFQEVIKSKETKSKETIENFKISNLDIKILRDAAAKIFDLEEQNILLKNRYKDNEKEINRQYTILSGRCRKLEIMGYLEKREKGYISSDLGKSILNSRKNKDTEKKEAKEEKELSSEDKQLLKYKLTKFDFDNIANASKDNLWTPEIFKEKYFYLDKETQEKKITSIIKRMATLEEMGLVKSVGKNRYQTDEILIERSALDREKGTNKLSKEQKEILMSLKDFLNISDKQINEHIFNDKEILCRSDIAELIRKNYIGLGTRDLKGDGNITKIYYLKTDGKKAVSHLSGTEVKEIYNSKIHKRPEEIRHDMLVYPAYKDLESKLIENNCRILNYMTDKQMRAFDMNYHGHQREEYSDLYVEFEDIKTGEKSFVNIEVSINYPKEKILSKTDKIENLLWYTDNVEEKARIEKYIPSSKVIVLNH